MKRLLFIGLAVVALSCGNNRDQADRDEAGNRTDENIYQDADDDVA